MTRRGRMPSHPDDEPRADRGPEMSSDSRGEGLGGAETSSRGSRQRHFEPEDLPPGYQAGRGRGYATERAFEGIYGSERDLYAAERESRTYGGAWGDLRRSVRPTPSGRQGRQGGLPLAGSPRTAVGPSRGPGPRAGGRQPIPSGRRFPSPASHAARDVGEAPFDPYRDQGLRPGRTALLGGYGAVSAPAGMRGQHEGHGPTGYRLDDRRVCEAICDELMLHPDIDPSEVTVKVEDGEVTLTGTVPDRWTKFAIESLVESTLGTGEIHNRLRLRPPGQEEERSLSSDPRGQGAGRDRREGSEGASPTSDRGNAPSERLH